MLATTRRTTLKPFPLSTQFFGELCEHLRRKGAGQARQPLGVRQADGGRGPSICLPRAGRGERVGRDHENGRHEGALPSRTVSIQGAELERILVRSRTFSCIIELAGFFFRFCCRCSEVNRGDVTQRRVVFCFVLLQLLQVPVVPAT